MEISITCRLFWLYLNLSAAFIDLQHMLYTLIRTEQRADGTIVIQGVNDQGYIFAHITINIIWFRQQIRSLIYEICG